MAINKYPYTSFNEYNLDFILDEMKRLATEWAETKTEWADMKTELEALKLYITNYFNNLDVQVEINKKLDEMAADGTLSAIIAPYFSDAIAEIPATVSTWIDSNLMQEVGYVIDKSLYVADAAADALETGSEIRYIQDNAEFPKRIKIIDLEDGYYSSVDGTKQDNSGGTTYKRTPGLIPMDEHVLLYSDSGTYSVCCYTRDKTFIKRITMYGASDPQKRDVTPTNCAYVGIFKTSMAAFEFNVMKPEDFAYSEYPFTNCCHAAQYWMDGTGTIQSNTSLDLCIIPVKPGDKFYINNRASYNFLCFDISGTLLTTTYVDFNPYGKLYTIPATAVIAYVNIYRTHVYSSTNSHTSNYFNKITKTKKVLAIGDSLTWVDGRGTYDGAPRMCGWQKQIRKLGYQLDTAAWSGYPFTNELDYDEGVWYSIYKEIVTNAYDVTGYDIIILFAGTNDVRLNAPKGALSDVYSNRTFDPNTFNGAFGGVISYIRETNAACKIYIADFPKSEDGGRPYARANEFVTLMKNQADFWSCRYISIFQDMGVQPTYDDFDEYFYDATHPNYKGMELIGELIADGIEKYE